jgi:nascent polypeptide-associated complex subunit alpha
MLGGMDPKTMEAAMKKMGIKTKTIPATEVVIRGEQELVIRNPQVTVMEMRGQHIFQIVGIPEEKGKTASSDDVALVAQQANVSLDAAKRALEESGGDIAGAILRLGK